MNAGEQEFEIYECSLFDDVVGENDGKDDYNIPSQYPGFIRYPGVSKLSSASPSKPMNANPKPDKIRFKHRRNQGIILRYSGVSKPSSPIPGQPTKPKPDETFFKHRRIKNRPRFQRVYPL
ncbi:hypothetical protein E1B28_003572 [Marasmius oreades]|uniref:Uncharacterized protein n=1 Tax=Marasmius oreades TaxID=181124 RepID=A0A9P7RLT0_9AGAR|nr:uncharacterized protein E1B28_003572 [Marasmius oreades]KAG7086051.1 hypothetical protein E1B28_003572 [Marasmius oreades]